MGGWAEKFIGNTLRIAGLLHCVQNKEKSGDIALSGNTMRRAIKIARYFLKQAKHAYSTMGMNQTLHGAKRIISKLQKQSKTELTKYQIHRMLRYEYTSVPELAPSIELLVEYGYLKERRYDEPTGGRPRGKGYVLNPLFFGKK